MVAREPAHATRKPSRQRTFGQINTLAQPIAMSHQIHTYTELQQQIHDDLRIQHPDWVNSDGSSPTCDSYESRLRELLGISTRRGSNESAVATHRALDQEATRQRLIQHVLVRVMQLFVIGLAI